jgi:hypothetical protein
MSSGAGAGSGDVSAQVVGSGVGVVMAVGYRLASRCDHRVFVLDRAPL